MKKTISIGLAMMLLLGGLGLGTVSEAATAKGQVKEEQQYLISEDMNHYMGLINQLKTRKLITLTEWNQMMMKACSVGSVSEFKGLVAEAETKLLVADTEDRLIKLAKDLKAKGQINQNQLNVFTSEIKRVTTVAQLQYIESRLLTSDVLTERKQETTALAAMAYNYNYIKADKYRSYLVCTE